MTDERFEFVDLRSSNDQESFADHVRNGLSTDQKQLSPRFFYDDRGSELFEQITQLSEYYPYSVERRILTSRAGDIASYLDEGGALIELGSGNADKTRILLDECLQELETLHYVPVDISGEFLRDSSQELVAQYNNLSVTAISGTYETALKNLPDKDGPRLILLLGSNIGNYSPPEARKLLSDISLQMNSADRLMVGIDLLKDPKIIERAYNDERGVTSAFNKNILTRINRELDGEFEPVHFRHHAPFVPEKNRVEMHLVSKRNQSVPVHALDQIFEFEEGESIHTENSYKFDEQSFENICRDTGLEIETMFRDDRDYFAEVILS